MTRRRLLGLLALALAVAFGAATPARGADGVSPADAAAVPVDVDASGYVSSPATVDLAVRLDALDSDATVWVSDSADRTSAGLPAGTPVAACAPADLHAAADGALACAVSTLSLSTGKTYWWWVDYTRRAPGSSLAERATAGPWSFTLSAPGAPQATKKPQRFVTATSAAHLASALRWHGSQSIKHTTLTRVLYRTMKARWKGPTKRIALACWTHPDFDALMASNGQGSGDGFFEVMGVWVPSAPHWVHLDAKACAWAQRLIDTHRPSAFGAYGLVAALHETMHAYGIEVEAQANCYAVQLVPTAARILGLPAKRADSLGRLALSTTRLTAPPRYWDATRCRGGGAWDLTPKTKSL